MRSWHLRQSKYHFLCGPEVISGRQYHTSVWAVSIEIGYREIFYISANLCYFTVEFCASRFTSSHHPLGFHLFMGYDSVEGLNSGMIGNDLGKVLPMEMIREISPNINLLTFR